MCYVMPTWRSSLGLIANVIHQKQQVSNSSLRIILCLQSKLRVRLFTITSSRTLKKARALYIWYNLFMICQHVNCMIIIIRWVRKLICWCIYLSNVKDCKWTKLYINNLDLTLKICFVYIYIYIVNKLNSNIFKCLLTSSWIWGSNTRLAWIYVYVCVWIYRHNAILYIY